MIKDSKISQFVKWLKKLAVGAILIVLITGVAPPVLSHATALPQVSINNSSILEGTSGNRNLTFDVTLSEPSTVPVTVQYSTADQWRPLFVGVARGTASVTTGADYTSASSQMLTFNAGQVKKTVVVPVLGDTVNEPDEVFNVVLSNPSGATLADAYGTGTIINDDSSSGFQIGIGDISIREGNKKARIVDMTIGFSAPAPAPFSLTATTVANSATGVATAATKGGDFVLKTQTFSVAKGAKFKNFTINLLPDTTVDSLPAETFFVNISSTYGTVIKPSGTVKIRDDDMVTNRAGRLPGPPRVVFLGDSVTANYEETAKNALEDKGYAVFRHGIPGSSILDADKCWGQQALSVLNNDDPDIVVYENIANYRWFAPCDPLVEVNTPVFFQMWQSTAQGISKEHYY